MNFLNLIGYSLISYAFTQLWKINKTCLIVESSKFKNLEERIRADERRKINVNREN